MNKDFENDFSSFLKKIGKETQVPYAASIIACDADKCTLYKDIWERNGIPYEHGVMIYLITKMKPYYYEARVKLTPCEFVIKHYDEFKQYFKEEENEGI